MTHDDLKVIIDSGGNLTLQCDSYVHAYDGSSTQAIADQAATDVAALLQGENPSDWESNEPRDRINYTADQVRDGWYDVLDIGDIQAIVNTDDETKGGYMGAAFAAALRAKIGE